MSRSARLLVAASLGLAFGAAADSQKPGPRTIVDLQPFRQTATMSVPGPGSGPGAATLVDLNPQANAWFLLTLRGSNGGERSYHLENADPDRQHLRLAQEGLVLTAGGRDLSCELWAGDAAPLERASASGLPYAPLCGGRLYLRNLAAGRRSDLERVTDFLRDHVWGGETIVGFVREEFYGDAFLERARAR